MAQPRSPSSSTLTNGFGTFQATLATAGTQIFATDTTSPTISGSSNGITVSTGTGSTGTLLLSSTSLSSGQSISGTVCNFAQGLSTLQVTLTSSSNVTQTYSEPVTSSTAGCYTVPIPTSTLPAGFYTATVSNGSTSTTPAQFSVGVPPARRGH